MGSFNYMRVEVEDSTVLTGDAILQTDAFSKDGLNLSFLTPPYNGVEEDTTHSTRIQNAPQSRTFTTIPNGLVATGLREINADIFALKLGPYLEIPMSERLSATMNAGFVLGLASSEFNYRESNTIASIGVPPAVLSGITTTQNFSGSDSSTEILPGGFAGLQVNYDITGQWRIFAGGQLQFLQSLEQSVNGRESQLNLGKAFLLQAGLSYSF
jgi:hypothetical protein